MEADAGPQDLRRRLGLSLEFLDVGHPIYSESIRPPLSENHDLDEVLLRQLGDGGTAAKDFVVGVGGTDEDVHRTTSIFLASIPFAFMVALISSENSEAMIIRSTVDPVRMV